MFAGHAWHGALVVRPVSPKKPGIHAHVALPSVDVLPAGQVVQNAAPAALNMPARHWRQPDWPVLFWKVPAGHAWQLLSVEPPVARNVPCVHDTQLVWPVSVW